MWTWSQEDVGLFSTMLGDVGGTLGFDVVHGSCCGPVACALYLLKRDLKYGPPVVQVVLDGVNGCVQIPNEGPTLWEPAGSTSYMGEP